MAWEDCKNIYESSFMSFNKAGSEKNINSVNSNMLVYFVT